MLNKLKYLLIGPPLPSQMMAEKRLNKLRALAAFSPDALSSVAYANQEIFLALAAAGAAGLSFQSLTLRPSADTLPAADPILSPMKTWAPMRDWSRAEPCCWTIF
jgi:hypothetical protein